MGKYPERERRFIIRRLVESCEEKIEVSELEKVLSHLAFLMNLHLQDDEVLHKKIREVIGNSETFRAMSEEHSNQLTELSIELSVKYGIVLFYMWRSWLLQKDLCASFGSDADSGPTDIKGEPRNSLEWDYLQENLIADRASMRNGFYELAKSLEELCSDIPSTPGEAAYALQQEQGSPLATLKAAEYLLAEAQQKIVNFRKQVHKVYGYSDHHRPNKRFDKRASRNLAAFYYWRKGETGESLYSPFLKDGMKVSGARQAAQKAASRFEEKLGKYQELLTELEQNSFIPQVFFARKIGSRLS